MIFKVILCLIILWIMVPAQQESEKLTSYKQLGEFVQHLDETSDLLKTEQAGNSVEGRKLYAMFFSNGEFGEDNSKIKIFFFCQQHGNEHSGKEGALLLAKELTLPENKYLFDRIDFLLVPQVNPDGSERDSRYNGNKKDLNRNHLILTEPEAKAVHNLFNKYKFEISLDVHEYYPFTDGWKKYGYYKRSDEQLGLTSNLNVSLEIRDYSRNRVLPFIKDNLEKNNYSFNEYIVGGPPDADLVRHSTVDIDDGRQSIGIQNTLSFILEGKNGRESSLDHIRHRAEGQKTAMLALLKYAYNNSMEIKALVQKERDKLFNSIRPVVLRMEHTTENQLMSLPVSSVSGTDTVIKINNYYPVVRNILQVLPPDFYMIPKSDSLLIEFIGNHNITYKEKIKGKYLITRYNISGEDTSIFEGTRKADHKISLQKDIAINTDDYIFIPVSQLKRNTVILAFEPQSMLGLIHYPRFAYLSKDKEYPVLRADKKYSP